MEMQYLKIGRKYVLKKQLDSTSVGEIVNLKDFTVEQQPWVEIAIAQDKKSIWIPMYFLGKI